MIPLLLLIVSAAAVRQHFEEVDSRDGNTTQQPPPSIPSTTDGAEEWGVLDWSGCEMHNNMTIVGIRSLCFKSNAVAHHCFSVLDVEDDKEQKAENNPAPLEGAEPGYADVDVNVTANWENKDLLMLDPWSHEWVPVRIQNVAAVSITLRYLTDYWIWYRVKRNTRFRTFKPKSIMLELLGDDECKRSTGAKFTLAKVHCVSSPLKLEGANMEYAKMISSAGNYKKPVQEHKRFVQAGKTLGAYWSWKEYKNPLPTTVAGLKAWAVKYLHGYPAYKAMTHNCQQFDTGVYQAVAATPIKAERRQSTKMFKVFESMFSGSSQSSGTTGSFKICECYCKSSSGFNKKDVATRVCIYDWACKQRILFLNKNQFR